MLCFFIGLRLALEPDALKPLLYFYILESEIDMKKTFITEIIIYFICVTLAALLWSRPIVLSLGYIFISIFMLCKWHAKSDFVFYFVAFVLGPLGELVAIYFGAWEYSKPLYFIPVWLPFLWGIAALFMKKLSETLLSK